MNVQRMRRTAKVAAVGVAALVALPGTASADRSAAGDHPARHFVATLRAVPHDPAVDGGSDASGQASLLVRRGNLLTASIEAAGLSPQVHVMHIHGAEQAAFECPGPDRRDDRLDDGLIDTVEGLPDYGPVVVSFTTSGDTSPDSTLAVDRFLAAGPDGRIEYRRTFDIPTGIAANLENQHIVIHGHDIDGDGAYGGAITPLGVPIEAELPVACGEIDAR